MSKPPLSSYQQGFSNALTLVVLTGLALLAFAGNSLLTRAALQGTRIDEASFTSIRVCSGAVILLMLCVYQERDKKANLSSLFAAGNWHGAAALLLYAAAFTWAYRQLSAATGALILFAMVQATMVGYTLVHGQRLRGLASLGLVVAVSGLIGLLLPGLQAPPLSASLLMGFAGTAWGAYSILGQTSTDPLRTTAGNFLRAAPFSLLLLVLSHWQNHLVWPDLTGAVYATLSGGLTSGLGYAVWYRVLPQLKTQQAATLQLSVPVITTLGGMLWLGELPSARVWLASIAILVGIFMVIQAKRP
jgi:drug/metabolite transporter (DMT)-like permease